MNDKKSIEKRNTVQRNLVLQAIRKHDDHPTADMLYEEIRNEHPKVSRGTVYRNLNVLAELGEINAVIVPEGPKRFEAKIPDHHHFMCRSCGMVQDVFLPPITYHEQDCPDLNDCLVENQSLVLTGLCPECKKKHAKNS